MNDLEILQTIQELNQLDDSELVAFISVCENEKIKIAALVLWSSRQQSEHKTKHKKVVKDFTERIRKAGEPKER